MTVRTRLLSLMVAALLGAACTPSQSGRPGSPNDTTGTIADPAIPASGGPTADTGTAPPTPPHPDTTVQRLEREARALARADGCEQSGQCRTAPLGSRACGGPRDYVVYCPLTTDSAALFRKLGELARAEEAYNRAAGVVSTCEFRMAPQVEAVGGRCVARARQ